MNPTYDTILVPTDGSAPAGVAAGHAVTLAAAFGGELHALSVVDDRAYRRAIGGSEVERAAENWRAAAEERAAEAARTLESLADEAGVPCHAAVEHGAPAEAIRTYAATHGADLVTMGTHGRTGLDRLLLGSVTERVVRTSDVPVLTAHREPEETGYDRVLVPTDGSETATAAVGHALAVAERFGATVHALSVLDVGVLPGVHDAGGGLPGVTDRLRSESEEAAEAVAAACRDRGLDAVTAVVQGTPYRVIGRYAADEGIDLVAMGTHGRTGVGRYLVGSVAERVLRSSDAPVLTVR